MWVKAREKEKSKEKHVNGAMFLTHLEAVKWIRNMSSESTSLTHYLPAETPMATEDSASQAVTASVPHGTQLKTLLAKDGIQEDLLLRDPFFNNCL
jgi:hypothetical protein